MHLLEVVKNNIEKLNHRLYTGRRQSQLNKNLSDLFKFCFGDEHKEQVISNISVVWINWDDY